MEPETSIQNVFHIPVTCSGLLPKFPSALRSEEPLMYEGGGLLVCNAVQSARVLGSEKHVDYILRIGEQTNCISLLLEFA